MISQAEIVPVTKQIPQEVKLDATPEMGQRKVECFKCSQRGHIAVNSPVVKKDPATLVVTSEPDKEAADPWVLQLIMDGEDTSSNSTTLSLRGPVYKVIVQVEGIQTRALVDFGAQVI